MVECELLRALDLLEDDDEDDDELLLDERTDDDELGRGAREKLGVERDGLGARTVDERDEEDDELRYVVDGRGAVAGRDGTSARC